MVEDDEVLAELLARKLKRDALRVQAARSAEVALEILGRQQFDLVILDVGLPDMSGFDLCREIRRSSDVPVMFLTGADTLTERLAGFDLGGDDYIVKPANLHELLRRVRALLRRSQREPVARELRGPAEILVRPAEHVAFVGDQSLNLKSKEFALLVLLLARKQEVLDADTISREVWGYETFGSRNFVEQQISRLRAQLRDAGAANVIDTVRGAGYVIR